MMPQTRLLMPYQIMLSRYAEVIHLPKGPEIWGAPALPVLPQSRDDSDRSLPERFVQHPC